MDIFLKKIYFSKEYWILVSNLLEKLVGKNVKQELAKTVKEIKTIALQSQLQMQEKDGKNPSPKKPNRRSKKPKK